MRASPSQASALQVLSLSDTEEGIGHNVERAQELQQQLGQRGWYEKIWVGVYAYLWDTL